MLYAPQTFEGRVHTNKKTRPFGLVMVRMFIRDLLKIQANPASDIVFCIHIRLLKQSKRKDRYYAGQKMNSLTDRLATILFRTSPYHPKKQIFISVNGVSECRRHSNGRTDRAVGKTCYTRIIFKSTSPLSFQHSLLRENCGSILQILILRHNGCLILLSNKMKERVCVAEQLKDKNQMLWVQMTNNIQNRAKEIVCEELIYT